VSPTLRSRVFFVGGGGGGGGLFALLCFGLVWLDF
jgi:uncharacterized membrane protein